MNQIKKTGLIVSLFFTAFYTGANNYYINSNIGDDSNNGASKESPWKSLINLNIEMFQPGDSILFASGTSYKGGFVFSCSGTAEKPIVFSNYSLGADIIRTTPRNQLESLFVKYGGGPAPAFTNPDWDVLNGNIFHIKGSYVVIEGLYFFENTYPPNSDHKNKNVQKMGVVYLSLGSNYNIVRNCEFFHSPVGIKVKGSYNLITHNYLHDANNKLAYSWGPLAIMVVKPNNEISYNTIVNYGSYGGPYGSDGGVIELDGVDDDFEGKNVNIHHNISINNHGFLELAGRGMDSITVAYNLSDDTNQFIGGGSMRNIFVYNNTIIRIREPNVDRYIFWTFKPDSTSLILKNNIFVLPPDIQVYGPLSEQKGHHRSRIGNQPHSNNLYYSIGNRNPDPLGGIPKGEGDLIADPLFVDFANRNFRLKKNSPAINSGINLGYMEDIDGRQIIGRPDIGAFAY
jgi:hypothetical protein